MKQGGGGSGLRGPLTAPAGGTIEVEVEVGAEEVEVGQLGSGHTTRVPVRPDRKATIPVPTAPNAVLVVTVGRGPRRKTLYVEVVSND